MDVGMDDAEIETGPLWSWAAWFPFPRLLWGEHSCGDLRPGLETSVHRPSVGHKLLEHCVHICELELWYFQFSDIGYQDNIFLIIWFFLIKCFDKFKLLKGTSGQPAEMETESFWLEFNRHFDIRKVPSSFFFLEKSLLSLASHMRTCDSVFIFVFYICLSVFANWDFARDCVKFLDQFGSIAILTNYMFWWVNMVILSFI